MNDESGERSESRGIGDAVERSSGDPRVLLAMNAVLSTWFAWIVVWGLDFVGSTEFALRSVATLALVIFALTYVLVLR
jgi:hypothetical protein